MNFCYFGVVLQAGHMAWTIQVVDDRLVVMARFSEHLGEKYGKRVFLFTVLFVEGKLM